MRCEWIMRFVEASSLYRFLCIYLQGWKLLILCLFGMIWVEIRQILGPHWWSLSHDDVVKHCYKLLTFIQLIGINRSILIKPERYSCIHKSTQSFHYIPMLWKHICQYRQTFSIVRNYSRKCTWNCIKDPINMYCLRSGRNWKGRRTSRSKTLTYGLFTEGLL